MKEGILRAIAYQRVSTDAQEDNTSLRDQHLGNIAKANAIGANIVATFEDVASGSLYHSREGLQGALRMLEEKKGNLLIVKDLTRLTRNERAEQAEIFKRIEKAGAKLIFWNADYENTPEGHLSRNITGDFAVYERQVFKERSMRGRLRCVKEGNNPCRQAPFGYIIPNKNDVIRGIYTKEQLGKYFIHPTNSKIAIECFERVASGQSLNSTAKWLQDSGFPTTRGGRCWSVTNVRDIITNTAYYGKAAFGKNKQTTDETRLSRGFKSVVQVTPVPESEWLWLDCPPLVSKALWDRCRAVVQANKETLCTREARRQMLTGLIRCPRCKRVASGRAANGPTAKKNFYYHCKNVHKSNSSDGFVCWNKFMNIDAVDALVIQAVKLASQNAKAVELAYQDYKERLTGQFSDSDYEILKRDLSELNKAEMNTVKAQIQGITVGADTTAYETILHDLAIKKTGMKVRLEKMEKARQVPLITQDRASIVSETIAEVSRVLDAATEDVSNQEKNALLRKIIESVYPINEDVKKFQVTFHSFDGQTRLVIDIGAEMEPSITVESLKAS